MFKKFVLIILLLTYSQVVEAQTNQAQVPTSQPIIRSRVGLKDTSPIKLTMHEAITLALENNRDIEVERVNILRSEFELAAAQGAFDLSLGMKFSYERHNTPVASLLAGGENGNLQTSSLNSSATFTKKLTKEGGDIKLSIENHRATSESLFNPLNPEHRTRIVFEYTQPLFRNRKIDSARHQIKVRSKELALSDIEFRQRVIEVISEVKNAYWDLVFAYRNEEIKRESIELAKTQLQQNERLVKQGIVAPSDIVSAQVEIERRTDEAESALDTLQRAENRLKSLMLQPSQTELWNTMLLPSDQPSVDLSELMSFEDALKIAFQNRPEMEQYYIKSDLNKTNLEYFRDQIKPEVNLIALYGTSGLAGNKRNINDPITMANQPLFDRINQLSKLSGLPIITPTFNNSVAPRLVGGYGQSLTNLFKSQFNNWQIGININFSFGNRTAKAQFGNALARERQLDIQQERTQQNIEVEVRNALQTLSTAHKRVEAASNSYTNAQLQYEAEQRKFEAGFSTNFLILDRQNALSLAHGRKIKALTDYKKAVAELQRTLSTTLSSKNTVVSQE
jgi:HAE1 family hydrophobic/amphiphilic exporter-1